MKTSCKIVSVCLLALMATLVTANPPTAAEEGEQGWTTLFNGTDLDGWKFHFGQENTVNDGTFTVRDGILICSGKPAGYMFTAKSYGNYTLQFELAFAKPEGLTDDSQFRGNSGCLIHVAEANALGVWPRSIEVQGMNRQLGLILPIPRNLKCTRTFDAEASEKARQPVGEFNLVEIEVNGGDMVIKLNGVAVSTVGDCELTQGPIGFQSEGAETHWKNIRIRERDRTIIPGSNSSGAR
jgi:hypothetical protein